MLPPGGRFFWNIYGGVTYIEQGLKYNHNNKYDLEVIVKINYNYKNFTLKIITHMIP